MANGIHSWNALAISKFHNHLHYVFEKRDLKGWSLCDQWHGVQHQESQQTHHYQIVGWHFDHFHFDNFDQFGQLIKSMDGKKGFADKQTGSTQEAYEPFFRLADMFWKQWSSN